MYFAIDTETTGLHPHNGDRAFLITTYNEQGEAKAYQVGIDSLVPLDLDMMNPDNQWIGHNLQFDLAFLANLGMHPAGPLHDTLLAAHIHNPLEPTKALKALTKKYLDRENKEEAAVLDWFNANGMKAAGKREYIKVPEELIIPYALADVQMTLQLWQHYKKLGVIDNKVYKFECSLIPVVVDIVRQGMKIDATFAKTEAERTSTRAVELLRQANELYTIDNIGSNEQLADYLKKEVIDKLGKNVMDYPITQASKDNPTQVPQLSMDAIALQEYEHPIIPLVLEYRDLIKMNGTYLQAMLHLTDKEGVLHASLNQTGARTGRFSSSNPNLQNIPRGGGVVDIRRGFIPRTSDHRLLLIDLSQIELRILAHYCQEPAMCAALSTREGDLHAGTAQSMFGSTEKSLRTIAKTLNFAVIYGAGSKRLRDTLNRALPDANFTLEQTAEFKSKYYATYPKVQQFKWKIEKLVIDRGNKERIGYVDGFSGRRYYCETDAAYRILNYLVQGESAMFFKRKMLEIFKLLQSKQTKLSNVIHDEFIFDLHKDEEDLIPQILSTIEDLSTYRVPIFANAAISSTCWAEKGTWVAPSGSDTAAQSVA
jgi:DNA polymerase-1